MLACDPEQSIKLSGLEARRWVHQSLGNVDVTDNVLVLGVESGEHRRSSSFY